MSAYIVNDHTINAIVAFFGLYNYQMRQLSDSSKLIALKEKAQLLIDENYRSVNHRYKSEDQADKTNFTLDMLEAVEQGKINPAMVAGCCSNLEYQSCENEDYFDTPAFKFLQEVRKEIVDKVIPRDSQSWGIDQWPETDTIIKLSSLCR